MKALVGAFNQEKALVGAFSVIVKTDCETHGALHSTIRYLLHQGGREGVIILQYYSAALPFCISGESEIIERAGRGGGACSCHWWRCICSVDTGHDTVTQCPDVSWIQWHCVLIMGTCDHCEAELCNGWFLVPTTTSSHRCPIHYLSTFVTRVARSTADTEAGLNWTFVLNKTC